MMPRLSSNISLVIMNKMIRLSINVLSAIRLLLKNMERLHLSYEEELWSINTSQINALWLIDIVKQCGWMVETSSKTLMLTEKGHMIIAEDGMPENTIFRVMLSDYIVTFCPVWCYRIPYGRAEAALMMTKDERACFQEAGLLCEFPDDDVVKWWDSLSAIIRKNQDENKNDCGRAGEKLSLYYEKRRTGIAPQWVSVDSNLLGYDVLSQISKNDFSKLLIETKASEMSMDNAYCHISINEWRTATTAKDYLFYFWLLGTSNMLAKINVSQLKPYIPTNNLAGEWESVKIPFKCFKDFFEIISGKDEEVL